VTIHEEHAVRSRSANVVRGEGLFEAPVQLTANAVLLVFGRLLTNLGYSASRLLTPHLFAHTLH
jgi:hypothetical protein